RARTDVRAGPRSECRRGGLADQLPRALRCQRSGARQHRRLVYVRLVAWPTHRPVPPRVNTLQALVLPLLPLPLFYIILTRGHYRRCLLPFAAVFGIYVFTCLGSPVVVADHELYSNTYFFTMLLVVSCCYVLYAVLFALRSAVFVDYSSVVRVPDLSLTLALIVPLWAYSVAML